MKLLIMIGFLTLGMGNKEASDASDEVKFCTMDAKECEDGSFVARDPDNNCEFKKCPSGKKKNKQKADQ